jgi:hypothetical protein
VTDAEFYLDESESGVAGQWLSVAGWVFPSSGREALEVEWSKLLLKHGLPFFRMGDCAQGAGHFSHFDKSARAAIQREFFGPLVRHAVQGYCASFDTSIAHRLPFAVDNKGARFHVTPYTMCCYWALLLGRRWAEYNGFHGRIHYRFEAGHASQPQARRMMDEVFSNPHLREFFRYGSHAFVDKRASGAVQCADILAWQWGKNVKDRANGRLQPRADLLALLKLPCDTVHFDEPTVTAMLEQVLGYVSDGGAGTISSGVIESLSRSVRVSVLPSCWAGLPPHGWLPV